jgi:hypothetical protein
MRYDKLNNEGIMAQFRDHKTIIQKAKILGKRFDMSFSQICRRGLRMAIKTLEDRKSVE